MCEYIILKDFRMDKYIYDENNELSVVFLSGKWYVPIIVKFF